MHCQATPLTEGKFLTSQIVPYLWHIRPHPQNLSTFSSSPPSCSCRCAVHCITAVLIIDCRHLRLCRPSVAAVQWSIINVIQPPTANNLPPSATRRSALCCCVIASACVLASDRSSELLQACLQAGGRLHQLPVPGPQGLRCGASNSSSQHTIQVVIQLGRRAAAETRHENLNADIYIRGWKSCPSLDLRAVHQRATLGSRGTAATGHQLRSVFLCPADTVCRAGSAFFGCLSTAECAPRDPRVPPTKKKCQVGGEFRQPA